MIYLAGSCASEQRALMKNIAKLLRDRGEEVYCPFELQIPNAWDMSQEAWSEKVFQSDVAALDNADLFLMISPGRISSAGTNWEQGYSYAKNKKIIVVQYTGNNTSLMTYVGSTLFINSSAETILEDIEKSLYTIAEKNCCATTLT